MASQAVIIEARRGPIIRPARVVVVDAGSMARGNPLDKHGLSLAEFCKFTSNFPRKYIMTPERIDSGFERAGSPRGQLEAGRTVRDTHAFGDKPSPSPRNWAEG